MVNILPGTHPASTYAAPGRPISLESIHEADPTHKNPPSYYIAVFFFASRKELRKLSFQNEKLPRLPNFAFLVIHFSFPFPASPVKEEGVLGTLGFRVELGVILS